MTKKLKYVYRVTLQGGTQHLVSGNGMMVNNRGDLLITRDATSNGYLQQAFAIACFKTNSWVQASIVDGEDTPD